jgi:glycosyltransferase involved in cell wall biosynthesis
MKPKVSIVMPCYNAAAHLQTSIGSVLAQTRQDWELIIVDDGSTDQSWQILQQLAARDQRIRILQQSNAGAAAARNRALREARSACTAFLDSDDTWHPTFLEVMLTALDSDPGAGIAYCGWQNIGLPGKQSDPFIPPAYENDDKIESLLGGCRSPIHGALVRSQIIRDAGYFDEALSSCMDYDLWLRIGALHRLVRVPRVLAYYHHHSGEQITSNRARIAMNHWRAQQKFLQANPSIPITLGIERIRQLTSGELLRRGYLCYWKRDLQAARKIFRAVMKQGYGTFRDWKYMLPAWLPESWHRKLIGLRDQKMPTTDGQS